MNVPWLDLPTQYAGMQAEIDAAVRRVCTHGWFALGPAVERFERAWADYCEAGHCVAVSSGTAALHLALSALGVGQGDEVITSPLSFFATAEVALYNGARPVFADVEAETACLDPAGVEDLITERTRAIMPVHLFGHPTDMDPLLALAEEHGLAVVEDACQAHGALYKGRKVGALGAAGAFSFYPTKNLGAYGEGGALVTDDEGIAERARLLRAHGQDGPYRHATVGYNYRMHGIQGAVLEVKLRRLDEWNGRRGELAARYAEGLADLSLRPMREADYARCVWHLYPIRCEERDALQRHLSAAGVATGVHYPVLLPELEALRPLGLRSGDMAEARRWADEELSLPLFAEMTDEQADHVIETVRGFF